MPSLKIFIHDASTTLVPNYYVTDIRIDEWPLVAEMDVEFPEPDPEAVTQYKLARLNLKEEELVRQFQSKQSEIQKMKNNLLALAAPAPKAPRSDDPDLLF